MLRQPKKIHNCAAVIVETRNVPDIDYKIRRHMKYLNDKWKLYVFHGPENKEDFKDLNAIKIQCTIRSTYDYNQMITSLNFWNFISQEKILIFQSDSMLLKKGIERFLEWDYIGGPSAINGQPHLNGGLSLRSRSIMMKTIAAHQWTGDSEDAYFTKNVPLIGGKLAPYNIASTFCTEIFFKLNTLGYHGIEKTQGAKEVYAIKNQYKNSDLLIKLL